MLHKPHPSNELKSYQRKAIIKELENNNLSYIAMGNTLRYKGFIGTVNYSAEDKVLYGEVIGINGSITYEGTSISELEREFQQAVDHYIDVCNRNGKDPMRSFKGTFNVRVGSELHRKAVMKATSSNQSLNEFVQKAIEHELKRDGFR